MVPASETEHTAVEFVVDVVAVEVRSLEDCGNVAVDTALISFMYVLYAVGQSSMRSHSQDMAVLQSFHTQCVELELLVLSTPLMTDDLLEVVLAGDAGDVGDVSF